MLSYQRLFYARIILRLEHAVDGLKKGAIDLPRPRIKPVFMASCPWHTHALNG
jgi:hypothetical protein